MIDSCLRLHGLLCPPVFTPFHEQLVRFFKKNFRDEIRRLAVDSSQLQHDPTSPLSPSSSVSAGNLKRTLSTTSSVRNGTGWGAGRAMTMMTPPLESDDLEQDDRDRDSGGRWDYSTARNGSDIISVDHMHHTHHRDRAGSSAAAGVKPSASGSASGSTSTQTPLQRHLAHLAKHGIHAVSSGPNDTGGGIGGGANGGSGSGGAGGSDSMSINSFGGARDSMVVGTSVVPTGAASVSGSTSVKAPSYMGSMGSFGSIKGRLSRFGSLNFGSSGKRRYE